MALPVLIPACPTSPSASTTGADMTHPTPEAHGSATRMRALRRWPAGRHHALTGHPRRTALGLVLLGGALTLGASDGNSPVQLRKFIDEQVGGLQRLTVPARDEDLP